VAAIKCFFVYLISFKTSPNISKSFDGKLGKEGFKRFIFLLNCYIYSFFALLRFPFFPSSFCYPCCPPMHRAARFRHKDRQLRHLPNTVLFIYIYTLKPQYNKPFYNKIPAIKNLISSPSVVNSKVKIPSNNKIPAIKNKIFGPFRSVIQRFPCIYIDYNPF
jgi:hypothetical protein